MNNYTNTIKSKNNQNLKKFKDVNYKIFYNK